VPELVVLAEQLLAEIPGGTGRYTRELVGALARTAPERWSVATAVARRSAACDISAAVIDGVTGPRMLPLPPRALLLAWECGLPLWPGGDAVHAPTPLSPPAAPQHRSLTVTVHDTVPWSHPETLTRRGVHWHRKVITRAADRATAVVVPTGAVAAELARYAPGRAPLRVIPHGVTTPPNPPNAEEISRRLDLPDRYLLAVGTIEPRKGLDVLIAALGRYQGPPLPLLVVGAMGWGGVALSAIAAAHGLPPQRVRVLGRLPEDELAVVLRRAAVLAVPSLAEGFGLPLVEAMAVGTPVVHSDAPALVEVAGGTGLTVPRRDPAALAAALREALNDPAATAARVEAGLRRAEGFSWDVAARAVWRLHADRVPPAAEDLVVPHRPG